MSLFRVCTRLSCLAPVSPISLRRSLVHFMLSSVKDLISCFEVQNVNKDGTGSKQKPSSLVT